MRYEIDVRRADMCTSNHGKLIEFWLCGLISSMILRNMSRWTIAFDSSE